MSYTLYLDFETYDPELIESGSCYIWNPDFRIIGMSYAVGDSEPSWTDDYTEMRSLIQNALTLVAHNITYELGCIKWLNMQASPNQAIDVKYKCIFCTMIGSKLDLNTRNSHSLDFLAKSILKKEKDQTRFGRFLLSHKLSDGSRLHVPVKKYAQIQDKLYEGKQLSDKDKEYYDKSTYEIIKKLTSWAMQNLPIMYQIVPEIVIEYAISDVALTRDLHRYFLSRLDKCLYHTFSDLSKVTTEMRHKGVRVDLEAAQKAYDELGKQLDSLEQEAKTKGWWCNYGSKKELPILLTSLGIPLPVTDAGNLSTKKDVLEDIEHPIAKFILDYRKLGKIREDFVGGILKNHKNGRIHGTMNILGANATGRFSHTNPNLGNQPKRDKVLAPLLRGMFLPEEGETWYHMDFSAQEPRLYVHFAAICHKARPKYQKQRYDKSTAKWVFEDTFTIFNCPMITQLVQEYKNNPRLDSHEFSRNLIATTTGVAIDRSTTKTFALGTAYSKGVKSTAEQLGISLEAAREFAQAFDKAAPYIKMTSDYCMYLFVERGYIKTILGRKNHFDGVGYRGYNYLIQGSAADQTGAALLTIYYKYDIIPLTVVHDEVNISAPDISWAEKVKHAMEHTIELEIPSYTEITSGKNWAEAK